MEQSFLIAGQAMVKEIHTSGGTSGRFGTGRRSSVHASPAISVATRRQNATAAVFESWKATFHGPGCREITSRQKQHPAGKVNPAALDLR